MPLGMKEGNSSTSLPFRARNDNPADNIPDSVRRDSQNLDDIAFGKRVNKAIVASLEKTLGVETTLDLEDFLNKHGTSLWNTYQDAENVSRLLCDLFNEDGAGLVIRKLIKDAMQSCGIKSNKVRSPYHNLKDALDSMRILVAIMVCSPCIAAVSQIQIDNGLPIRNPEHNSFDLNNAITITEYLEDEHQNPAQKTDQSRMINLIGFWDVKNKPTLTVSFDAVNDLPFRDQILNYSKRIIFDDNNTGIENHPSWHKFLSNLSEDSSLEPYPDLMEKSQDGNSTHSDIHIILTSQENPRRNGQASITMSAQYIESVEITIFTTDEFYANGALAHVIEHEVGHALGLSHSNDVESIMYPELVIKNSSVEGNIAGCEERGLASLYQESIVQNVSCG